MLEQMPRTELGNIIASDKRVEKQLAWENKLKELDEVGDLLGNGLDEHIKDIVAAFNLNGFNTNQSCEGHDNSGLGAPGVSIEAPDEPEERYVGEKEVYQDVAERYGITFEDVKRANNEAAWVEAIELSSKNEETSECQDWKKENTKLRKKAEELVEAFYKNRTISDTAMRLEFENIGGGGTFRVHNGGEDYLDVREMTEAQKSGLAERLPKYREEMEAFGKFLKDKFFNRQ